MTSIRFRSPDFLHLTFFSVFTSKTRFLPAAHASIFWYQNLSYEADAWEQDEQGLWMATNFDCRCHSEPDIEESEDWNAWMRVHSDMPYVFQLPVDERVKRYIQKHYRFWMSNENHR
ncbi:hypothetical protein [Leadbetterella byssophila]|uniref:hypothetical protein n=1 Tax=Leadbetterella byssophila TaxID=316068 RepID=UPI00399F491D